MPKCFAKVLYKDYNLLLEQPIDGVLAHPTDNNIFEWHFVIMGPTDTPFEGGVYHGEMVFDDSFPIEAPSIYFITPNGLFECNSNLCYGVGVDVSNGWSPINTVPSILLGLWLAFKDKDQYLSPFTSTDIISSEDRQRELAKESLDFNLTDKTFCKYFPQLMKVKEETEENSNDTQESDPSTP